MLRRPVEVAGLVRETRQGGRKSEACDPSDKRSNSVGCHGVCEVLWLAEARGTVATFHGNGQYRQTASIEGYGTRSAWITTSYDLGSRLQSETADGSTRTFQYDTNNELTNDGLNSYSYDLNGNRTMTGYTTGPANELTSDGTWTYTYDGEGNTISKRNTTTGELWNFGYDNDNRMVTARDVSGAGVTLTLATYTYDVFGNRIEKDVWTQSGGTTTVTRFGYDGDQVWADLASTNTLQMRYLRGDEADQLFARLSGAGVAGWYLTDWEGSVRKLTDGSGSLTDTITYDGFGDVTAETNTTAGGAYKFDGMRFDAETGDYSTWGRTETPADGRWMQEDPSGLGPDANAYRVAGNDPTGASDPAGLADQQQLLRLYQAAWKELLKDRSQGRIKTDQEMELRALVVEYALSNILGFPEGNLSSRRNPAEWVGDVDPDKEFSVRAGVSPHVAIENLWTTYNVGNQRGLQPLTGCRKFAQLVYVRAVIERARVLDKEHNNHQLTERIDNAVGHKFSPSRLFSGAAPLMRWATREDKKGIAVNTLIPGDRVYVKNPFPALGDGLEGSNDFYVCRGPGGQGVFVGMNRDVHASLRDLQAYVRSYSGRPGASLGMFKLIAVYSPVADGWPFVVPRAR